MIKNNSTYHSLLSNWVLRFTLFWSVFLFSGFVPNAAPALPTTQETELVETESLAEKTISFQKARQSNTLRPLAVRYAKLALIAYNQQQEIAYLTQKRKQYFFDLPIIFLPNKTIRQTAEEAIFLS